MQNKSTDATAETPAPRPRRQIEYRLFLNGAECGVEAFLEALAAAGGRATVTAFEITEAAARLTPAGATALAEVATEARR